MMQDPQTRTQNCPLILHSGDLNKFNIHGMGVSSNPHAMNIKFVKISWIEKWEEQIVRANNFLRKSALLCFFLEKVGGDGGGVTVGLVKGDPKCVEADRIDP